MTDTTDADNQPIPAPEGSEVPTPDVEKLRGEYRKVFRVSVPRNVPDRDKDGIPPVFVDPDGPAGPKPGKWEDVRIVADPLTGRPRLMADLGWAPADDEPPKPIDEAIKERDGALVRAARLAEKGIAKWRAIAAGGLISLLVAMFYIIGIWNGLFGPSGGTITIYAVPAEAETWLESVRPYLDDDDPSTDDDYHRGRRALGLEDE